MALDSSPDVPILWPLASVLSVFSDLKCLPCSECFEDQPMPLDLVPILYHGQILQRGVSEASRVYYLSTARGAAACLMRNDVRAALLSLQNQFRY